MLKEEARKPIRVEKIDFKKEEHSMLKGEARKPFRVVKIDFREGRNEETVESREDRLQARRVFDAQRRSDAERTSDSHQTLFTFHRDLSNIDLLQCATCRELCSSLTSSVGHCKRCVADNSTPKLYSAENNMDPGCIPCQLQNLSQVEEMLISRILPIMLIYRLPHSQYGYSGHVLNLPQDITSFVNTLPRSPSNLDIVIIRKEGSSESHKELNYMYKFCVYY